VGSVIASLIVWRPFRSAEFAAAAELISDHDCHERAEWKAETGTSMPRGLRAAKLWLLAHPTGPGRASLLLPLGRLEEADAAIGAIKTTTPEGEFGVEILRQTRALLVGATPDLSRLHDTWRGLPDPRERRHRRECLALLDAQIAVDAGRDPITELATARREIDDVYWTMRMPWLLAKLYLYAALFTCSAALLSWSVAL
jgi:hypothetical protein